MLQECYKSVTKVLQKRYILFLIFSSREGNKAAFKLKLGRNKI